MRPDPEFKEEIDFRDLLRQPWKMLGFTYGYYLTAVAAIGLIYIFNLTDIGLNSVPAQVLADSTAFVKDIPYQNAAVIPPVDVKVVGHPSDSLLALGREVFKTNCVSCHGDNGMGDGVAGVALNPKPRNFHQKETWTNGPKVSQIYKTLEEGVPTTGMASFNYLPARDRFALAHFIRTWVPEPPIDAEPELQQLETVYQLSKGQVRAAHIPVHRAFDLVLKEDSSLVSDVAARVAVTANSTDRGATVFRRVAADAKKAVVSFTVHAVPSNGVGDFVKIVSADPLKVGFRANVVQLSNDDWIALYQFLRDLGSVTKG